MRPHAFTLLELLVTISILAVLIGLVLPSLAASQESARSAGCLSNSRQIAIGMLACAIDQDDRLPGAGGSESADDPRWFEALGAYFEAPIEAVARCPGDRSPLWADGDPDGGKPRRSSYASNFMLSGRLPGYESAQSLRAIPRPAMTVFSGELSEARPYAATDHYHPELWLLDPVGQPRLQLEHTRHNGKSAWAHLDGHAEVLGLSAVYELDPSSRIGHLRWITNRVDPFLAN